MDGEVYGWRDKQCIYNCCELVLNSSTYESAFNEKNVMLHSKVHCIVVCIIRFTQSKPDHSMHANLII